MRWDCNFIWPSGKSWSWPVLYVVSRHSLQVRLVTCFTSAHFQFVLLPHTCVLQRWRSFENNGLACIIDRSFSYLLVLEILHVWYYGNYVETSSTVWASWLNVLSPQDGFVSTCTTGQLCIHQPGGGVCVSLALPLVSLQQLVATKIKKLSAFVELKYSLPFLRKPDIKPCQESVEFNPHLHTLFLGDPLNSIPTLIHSHQTCLFLRDFPTKILCDF